MLFAMGIPLENSVTIGVAHVGASRDGPQAQKR